MPGTALFNAFDYVMKFKAKFQDANDRKMIEKIYFTLVELSSEDEQTFTDHETAILDLYYIPVYWQCNLYTDDSFKLSEVCRELLAMLSEMTTYSDN